MMVFIKMLTGKTLTINLSYGFNSYYNIDPNVAYSELVNATIEKHGYDKKLELYLTSEMMRLIFAGALLSEEGCFRRWLKSKEGFAHLVLSLNCIGAQRYRYTEEIKNPKKAWCLLHKKDSSTVLKNSGNFDPSVLLNEETQIVYTESLDDAIKLYFARQAKNLENRIKDSKTNSDNESVFLVAMELDEDKEKEYLEKTAILNTKFCEKQTMTTDQLRLHVNKDNFPENTLVFLQNDKGNVYAVVRKYKEQIKEKKKIRYKDHIEAFHFNPVSSTNMSSGIFDAFRRKDPLDNLPGWITKKGNLLKKKYNFGKLEDFPNYHKDGLKSFANHEDVLENIKKLFPNLSPKTQEMLAMLDCHTNIACKIKPDFECAELEITNATNYGGANGLKYRTLSRVERYKGVVPGMLLAYMKPKCPFVHKLSDANNLKKGEYKKLEAEIYAALSKKDSGGCYLYFLRNKYRKIIKTPIVDIVVKDDQVYFYYINKVGKLVEKGELKVSDSILKKLKTLWKNSDIIDLYKNKEGQGLSDEDRLEILISTTKYRERLRYNNMIIFITEYADKPKKLTIETKLASKNRNQFAQTVYMVFGGDIADLHDLYSKNKDVTSKLWNKVRELLSKRQKPKYRVSEYIDNIVIEALQFYISKLDNQSDGYIKAFKILKTLIEGYFFEEYSDVSKGVEQVMKNYGIKELNNRETRGAVRREWQEFFLQFVSKCISGEKIEQTITDEKRIVIPLDNIFFPCSRAIYKHKDLQYLKYPYCDLSLDALNTFRVKDDLCLLTYKKQKSSKTGKEMKYYQFIFNARQTLNHLYNLTKNGYKIVFYTEKDETELREYLVKINKALQKNRTMQAFPKSFTIIAPKISSNFKLGAFTIKTISGWNGTFNDINAKLGKEYPIIAYPKSKNGENRNITSNCHQTIEKDTRKVSDTLGEWIETSMEPSKKTKYQFGEYPTFTQNTVDKASVAKKIPYVKKSEDTEDLETFYLCY